MHNLDKLYESQCVSLENNVILWYIEPYFKDGDINGTLRSRNCRGQTFHFPRYLILALPALLFQS